jgi:release factor glutamine methyltransferase
MRTFRSELDLWKITLAERYEDREIQQLYRLSLEDLFGFSSSVLLTQGHQTLSKETHAELESVLQRLKSGEPYQYIVGFTYFDELKIGVSSAVLIPRPETEELVQWIDESLQSNRSASIIDWCTGSGCIALALKNRNNDFVITGVDYSKEALIQAKLNAEELRLDVSWTFNDALAPSVLGTFDVVVSNPPYIPIHEKIELACHVADHEPSMALFVPDHDALLFYRKLGEWSQQNLKPGGQLFFELHEKYALETKCLLEELGFVEVEIRRDLQGKERMLRCVKV